MLLMCGIYGSYRVDSLYFLSSISMFLQYSKPSLSTKQLFNNFREVFIATTFTDMCDVAA